MLHSYMIFEVIFERLTYLQSPPTNVFMLASIINFLHPFLLDFRLSVLQLWHMQRFPFKLSSSLAHFSLIDLRI